MDTSNEGSIAIIGMSGRFPGAKNIDEFWQNLKNGVESIKFFSDQELIEAGIHPTLLKNKNYVKAKGMLDNVAEFDAAFFGFSPKEAALTDPQQRLFLECAWEALENAGYNPKTYTGSIGVYGGMSGLDTYLLKNIYSNAQFRETTDDFQIALSNGNDFVCTRVSYKLNLRGPSIAIQTACSTSLVAVVMGYQSLLDYQCDMVLAGGAGISQPQKSGYLYAEGMILSPDGHCRAFDAQAQGAVDGNGVGMVVLKRLAEAVSDGDTIYAVIKGAAINNDGSAKVGYTAPSVEGQSRVIAEALALAEVSPETVGYIEAHGTGTPLGDPIEVMALTQAFRARTDKKGYCALGSVKTNIGHLDAAAGVTGLIKAVLALEYQMIPPNLHFETPNPKLDLANSPFYVNSTLTEWKTIGFPRRAGVNSFGIGGTNAHIVLEEAPPQSFSRGKDSSCHSRENNTNCHSRENGNLGVSMDSHLRGNDDDYRGNDAVSRGNDDDYRGNDTQSITMDSIERPHQLLLLSAQTESALEAATDQLAEHLKQHPELNLADVTYTYQIGREAFKYRRPLVCQTVEGAISALTTRDTKQVFTQTAKSDQEPTVVFMFSGQGAQYVNMGLELYQTESVFRDRVDRCANFLKPHLGMDLRTVLYPDQKQPIELVTQQLQQTATTQPALFTIEYALAQLWQSWGIQPKAMIGHSIGEYVAACLAGVFTLEEALELVATRGRLIQSVPAGAMLAVPLVEEAIRPLLNQQLDLATLNIPAQSVISGTFEAIEQLNKQLAERGIECQRLHTSHAFHSAMMEPILAAFLKQVQKVSLKLPTIPFVSNVTGNWISSAEATNPHYWVKHLRQTVRFAEGLQTIYKEFSPPRENDNNRHSRENNTNCHSRENDNNRHSRENGNLGVSIDSHLRGNDAVSRGNDENYRENDAILHGNLRAPSLILLEVGPGRTLSTFAKRHPDYHGQSVLTSLRHPKDDYLDSAFLLKTLGQLWSAGVTVDWSEFSANEFHYRLPLPTYPFERQRYWIDPVTPTTQLRADLLEKKAEVADWFYVPSWKRIVIQNINVLTKSSSWLVFLDDCGVGEQLVARLVQQGQEVSTVRVGERFTGEAQQYTLNPHNADDYETLLQTLSTQHQLPKTIVHLWSVTSDQETESGLSALDKLQHLGFYSLLFLAQALGKQSIEDTLHLEVISNHIQMVLGNEKLSPEKATLLGTCRVIPSEYSNITCRSMDIVLPEDDISSEKTLIEQLFSEIVTQPTDPIIAYRGQYRWISTVEPVRLEKDCGTLNLREKGVYLITGGLGGMGLTLAEYLATTVQAKLVLTTRSQFPTKTMWRQWLATHPVQDSVSQRIKKVQAIEASGVEVLIASADVANLEQMQTVITQTMERFGQLHGVIHAAGLVDESLIQQKTREIVEGVMAPKVKGTLVLDAVFRNFPLDFIVLCSSLNSVLGGVGRVEYCAASAFLDVFAQNKVAKQSLPIVISIGWDGWREVGMAAGIADTSHETQNVSIQKDVKNSLLSTEGVEVFNRILCHKEPHILVSTWDLPTRIAAVVSSAKASISKSVTQSKYSRPQLNNTYNAPRNALERSLATTWEKILGVEQIGIFDDFFELGGDSLVAVQLVAEINKIPKVKILTHTLLEKFTIAALAEFIQAVSTDQATPHSLVKIQTGHASKIPLFLVHPIGGHVYLYRDLAHCLGTEQPVYALQAQGVAGEAEPLTQIEVMATHYINALQTIQPEGPYLLGGHSFGGLVAFEMAQQLRAQGQTITLLFMLDTVGPTTIPEETKTVAVVESMNFHDVQFIAHILGLDTAVQLPISLEDFEQLSLKEQLYYFFVQSKIAKQVSHKEFMAQIAYFLDVIKANSQAIDNYIPKIYPGKLLFFRALERDAFLPINPEQSWIHLVHDIIIHDVPGNHTSINFSPNVEIIASVLKKYLL
ncbi:MAG: hypothetical protein BWK79_00785 [Beggiatoa sp. IS2]|nr:MAG: hypothetical protein BWK79_00785 [Beggiatoa sp. IS2]